MRFGSRVSRGVSVTTSKEQKWIAKKIKGRYLSYDGEKVLHEFSDGDVDVVASIEDAFSDYDESEKLKAQATRLFIRFDAKMTLLFQELEERYPDLLEHQTENNTGLGIRVRDDGSLVIIEYTPEPPQPPQFFGPFRLPFGSD